jgi:hypothetical protein
MTGDDMPCPISDIERGVIARLLSVPFPGRDELRAQLPFATVGGRCGCGCATVNLAVDRAAAPAPVLSSAPVSADLSDGEYYAGIVLLVDGEGYLPCLGVYSIQINPANFQLLLDTPQAGAAWHRGAGGPPMGLGDCRGPRRTSGSDLPGGQIADNA